MIQLILHLLGDYVTQSDWMADNKTKRSWPAFVHATCYSLPFLLLHPSAFAFAIILVSHFLIDRFRLARHVVWTKNLLLSPDFWRNGWPTKPAEKSFISPNYRKYCETWCWESCAKTGYSAAKPDWLAVWLLIAADNTPHLLSNYLALAYC